MENYFRPGSVARPIHFQTIACAVSSAKVKSLRSLQSILKFTIRAADSWASFMINGVFLVKKDNGYFSVIALVE
jgi:hypothetical protein